MSQAIFRTNKTGKKPGVSPPWGFAMCNRHRCAVALLPRPMIRFSFHPFEGWQLVAARELRNGQIAFSCSPSAWQEEVHALLATFCFTVGTTDDDMNVTESSTSGDPARIDDDVILRVVRDIAHGERLRMSR